MPNTPVSQKIGWYLSGYTDGEGSFCVSFSPRKKLKIGLEVRPSFSVSQNEARSNVLKLFKQVFKCGTIRPDRSDRTLRFEVRNLNLIAKRIIPFFERYPLMSAKNEDFYLFRKIVQLMLGKSHTNKKGIRKIIHFAIRMNPSGKRRYKREDLLSFLR